MPSKSVTLDDDQYFYITKTQGDDPFSARLQELVDLGIEVEEAEEAYSCQHCGKSFGNAGAKATHESTCSAAG